MKDAEKTVDIKHAVVYIVILAVACTALGVACGMLIEKRHAAPRLFPEIARGHPSGQPEWCSFQGKRKGPQPQKRMKARAREGVFERINQELGLSPEQTDRVKAVLEDTRQTVNQARDEFKKQLEQAKAGSDEQISEILTPEQQEKFKKLKTHAKERREHKRRERW